MTCSTSKTTIRIYSRVSTPFSKQLVLDAWKAGVATANANMPGVLPDKVDAEVHESINGRRFTTAWVGFELAANIPADAGNPDVQMAIYIAAGAMMQKLTKDSDLPAVHVVLDGQSENLAVHLLRTLMDEPFKQSRAAGT